MLDGFASKLDRWQMIQETSAGAVIFYEDMHDSRMFLVLHYPAGHWDFPKGALERGETEVQAAKREIFEETGLKIDEFYPDFRRKIDYQYRRQDGLSHKSVIFFLARSDTQKVRISFEHSGFDWLSFDQAMHRLTFENARGILKEANELILRERETGRVS